MSPTKRPAPPATGHNPTPKADALERLAGIKATLRQGVIKPAKYRPYIDYEVAQEEKNTE